MENWTFLELQEFIREDIDEFMGDGLDIRQASSRIQVEYAQVIESSAIHKLVIYLVLCEEGLKNGFLRDDIKSQTLGLLKSTKVGKFDGWNEENLSRFKKYINKINMLIS